MAHYIWDYSVSGFCTLSCTQKVYVSETGLFSFSGERMAELVQQKKQGQIYHEGNEAYASGLLT